MCIICEGKNLDGLTHLQCCENCGTIPELPSSLNSLELDDCICEFIPILPLSLTSLIISRCERLIKIPKLPENLFEFKIVSCRNISQLPKLPLRLKDLSLIFSKIYIAKIALESGTIILYSLSYTIYSEITLNSKNFKFDQL